MEIYEKLLRGLTEKIDIQNRELEAIKSKLEQNSRLKSDNKCTARNDRGPPRYQTNSSTYHRNYDGDCCYKEYVIKERVYFPRREPFGGYMGDHRWTNETRIPNRNVSDNYMSREMRDAEEKVPRVSEAVLKVRQNHLPFVVDKAVQQRTCGGCKRVIKRNSILIIHKEILAYPSKEHGWDRPQYGRDPIANFYHFEKRCLKLRGFEDTYLSLCYIEVWEAVVEECRAKIHEIGFRRPIKTRVKCINVRQGGGTLPTVSTTEEDSFISRKKEDIVTDEKELPEEAHVDVTSPLGDAFDKEDKDESDFDFGD